MDPAPHRIPLKTGPNRSVLLERPAGNGEGRVIKRFRAREWWRRPGDRGRARGEFRALEVLAGLGVRVPRPLELRRADGGWELAMELVPGARPLPSLLEEGERTPGAAALLARRLGELLARVHAAGVDHPDLHAGNLVVDGEGAPWLVDLARACIRGDPGPSILERDLVRLASDTRERVPPAWRRRFFLAWWRALPEGARAALGDRPVLGAVVERRAREHRRDQVRRNARRWLRGFDDCRPLSGSGARGLVRRELSPDEEARLVEAVLAAAGAGAPIPDPLDPRGELLVLEGDRRVEERWMEMGRAEDHRLPAALPRILVERGRRLLAAFSLPAPGRPREEAEPASSALGRLHGALRDRGFLPPPEASLWVSGAGEVRLGPESPLVEGEAAPSPPRDREGYAAAYLAEQRRPPAELGDLFRELADG